MALRDVVPRTADGSSLVKNGYALLTDLEDDHHGAVIGAMERFQLEFLSRTQPVWDADFPIPGDALAHFSRQWEYPYAFVNVGAPGRLIDAGSGITFFPFLLSANGFTVECCDVDDSLKLAERYGTANALTGCNVQFTPCSLTELPHPDASFDAGICISVLEHTGADGITIIRELARVIRPDGMVVLTCDLALREGGGIPLEVLSILLAEVWEHFEPVYPLDLRRPLSLLTSDAFLHAAPWRLPPPWRPPEYGQMSAEPVRGDSQFRSIAILGITARRKAPGSEPVQ